MNSVSHENILCPISRWCHKTLFCTYLSSRPQPLSDSNSSHSIINRIACNFQNNIGTGASIRMSLHFTRKRFLSSQEAAFLYSFTEEFWPNSNIMAQGLNRNIMAQSRTECLFWGCEVQEDKLLRRIQSKP